MPENVIPVDVVVVNYNVGTLLPACVLSAFRSGAARVIVVDNASVDNSVELLEQTLGDDERLTIIKNDKNVGFAVACNQGIRSSAANAILFLNPDAELAADALSKLYRTLSSRERIGMVGGFLCNPDGSEQPGGRRHIPSPGKAFVQAFNLGRLQRILPFVKSVRADNEPLPDVATDVEAISGACMLVKREAIDQVGLWDEGYFLHCEDLDWCMRFGLANWSIQFVPDAKVMHVWRACSKARPFFVEWHKHLGMLRFYRKFFRKDAPLGLWPLVTIGVLLRMLAVFAVHSVRIVQQRLGRPDA